MGKGNERGGGGKTYSSVLGCLSVAALEGDAVTFMLEALWGDEALNTWGFGVGFLAFALGLHFAADDEFADLFFFRSALEDLMVSCEVCVRETKGRRRIFRKNGRKKLTSSSLLNPKNLLIFVARFGPNRFGCTVSVNPGSSPSPCFTMLSASTLKSMATIHPRTLLRFRSPVRRGR